MSHLPQMLSVAVLALAVTLTGCGADEPARDRPAAASPPETQTSAAAPAPLPITAHVVTALPGFEPDGRAEAQDARAFAKEHEKDAAELRDAGFVSGSSLFFSGKGQDFALSVAGAYDDADAAVAEADRVFANNTEGDPSIDVTPIEVPGVPEARAATLTGKQGGTSYTGVEIVFVTDGVLHEVFAVGETRRFDVGAVVSAVTLLHEEVAGHPLA